MYIAEMYLIRYTRNVFVDMLIINNFHPPGRILGRMNFYRHKHVINQNKQCCDLCLREWGKTILIDCVTFTRFRHKNLCMRKHFGSKLKFQMKGPVLHAHYIALGLEIFFIHFCFCNCATINSKLLIDTWMFIYDHLPKRIWEGMKVIWRNKFQNCLSLIYQWSCDDVFIWMYTYISRWSN